ncbi:YncE family protein [Chloroflexota bacterium]
MVIAPAHGVGNWPWGICFDGTNIWVANTNGNTVTKLKASDGSTVGTYGVGNSPYGICFDGANIWVVNLGGNTVSKH